MYSLQVCDNSFLDTASSIYRTIESTCNFPDETGWKNFIKFSLFSVNLNFNFHSFNVFYYFDVMHRIHS